MTKNERIAWFLFLSIIAGIIFLMDLDERQCRKILVRECLETERADCAEIAQSACV